MTSAYLNQFHLQTGNSDQDQNHLPSPSSLAQRSSSFTRPLLFSSADVQGHVLCHGHPYELRTGNMQHNGVVLIDSGPNNIALYSATTKSNNNSEITKQTSNYGHRREDVDGSLKWMPSKIRWMKKLMLAPDHKVTASGARGISQSTQVHQLPSQDSSSGGANTTTTSPADAIRVCSDCNTTRTPLWRSGPQGPKSLCNACGIRQRKARRAMAAAAAAAGGGAVHNVEIPGKVQNEKLSELGNCLLPFKKRCKITNKETAQKKSKFNDDKNIISLSNGSSVHRVLPQDERDAAILLMALSCGIMYG